MSLAIQEEYLDNRGTGLEVEDTTSLPDADPWNPDLIRIHTRNFSLRQILDMLQDGDIDLAPDFQRRYVWTELQACGLIESILLGIPMPSFYFNEDRTSQLQVVDGVQRLTTVRNFAAGSFRLANLTYLKGIEGARFAELDGVFRRRLQMTQIVAHVIDPQTPYRVKFDIFRRINTGGSPLSPQEIRHCMSQERSRQFLRRLVHHPRFQQVLAPLKDHARMADREVALRLVAFHILTLEEYQGFRSLDAFLGEVTHRLDRVLSEQRLTELEGLVERALTNAQLIFGDQAFRKWPRDSEIRNPINRTLIEAWGTALAAYEPDRIAAHAAQLRELARGLMTDDDEFMDSTSGATGDPRKVRIRLERVRRLLEEVVR